MVSKISNFFLHVIHVPYNIVEQFGNFSQFPFFFVSLAEDEECEELDLNTLEEIALDETRGGTYLSLDELGVFLSLLASRGIYILTNILSFDYLFESEHFFKEFINTI